MIDYIATYILAAVVHNPLLNLQPQHLKVLADLPRLRRLDLSHAQVTDAGLKEIATLKSLFVLDLSGARMTDAGVSELTSLKQLRRLVVHPNREGNNVTVAGLRDLQRKTPFVEMEIASQAWGPLGTRLPRLRAE